MLLHCKCIDNYVNTKSFKKKIKEIVQKERKTAFSELSDSFKYSEYSENSER